MRNDTGHISVAHVSVSFSRWGQTVTALEDVSLEISPGEWLLLVGPNGSGKSTLLKALAGSIRPAKGEARVDGRLVHNLRSGQLARTVFLVHQDPLLGTASLLTVFENMFVADPTAKLPGYPQNKLRAHYKELLAPIGLERRMDQPVKLLSGGERQLLALCIAALRDAKVILLDEPLAALDPAKAELCILQIDNLHHTGKTIVQVAHDTRPLISLADRLLTLREGKIAADRVLKSPPSAIGN